MDQEILRQIITRVVYRVLAEALPQFLNRPGGVPQPQIELTRPGKSNSGAESANPELEPEKLVTEETVRQAWKERAVLIINKGVICTPLARDVIKELGVHVIWR